MTANRAAVALVALAMLGPAVAIGANALIHSGTDALAHDRLVELWLLSVVWAVVCLIGAYTRWRRH